MKQCKPKQNKLFQNKKKVNKTHLTLLYIYKYVKQKVYIFITTFKSNELTPKIGEVNVKKEKKKKIIFEKY